MTFSVRDIDYLFYCRDKPDTAALLDRLCEAHWSFMDGYADRLLARGPSLRNDIYFIREQRANRSVILDNPRTNRYSLAPR